MGYRPPQRRAPRQQGAFLITLSVLTAIFFLLGVAMLWLAFQAGLRLGPTPTPTATVRATYTPSPDARATHITEDMLTQVAVAATLFSQLTPGPPPAGEPIANANLPPAGTMAGTMVVQMPLVSTDSGQPFSPLPPPVVNSLPGSGPSPTPAVLYIPNASNGQPISPLPGGGPLPPLPQLSPAPGIPLPPTLTPIPPTLTPLPPTPTPMPPTPTTAPAGQLVANMKNNIPLRLGPSNVYTEAGTLGVGTAVQLRGRTTAGDWVYTCCLGNGASAWVRTAYVNIANNTLPFGAPQGADPNDPRWLPVQSTDPLLTPRPLPTAIPYTDFPLARYDIGNTGRVPQLPALPMRPAWSNSGQATNAFVSPVAVHGQSVIASSSDNHLYGLYSDAGNQRWIYNFQASTTLAPALQDDLIYLAYGRAILALREAGNNASLVWQKGLDFDATTSFMIWLDTLFIGVGDGVDARLVALRRLNPDDRREFTEPGSRIQLPAIGQETLFVGADKLWAVDINLWNATEIVWTSTEVFNVVVPPVYSTPGVVRLAELYVADNAGFVHAVDANTGVRFLSPFNTGGQVTALAVNDTYVYVVGNNMLRALGRNDLQQRWQQPINGNVRGGPFVTAAQVLVVTETGAIQFFDAASGNPIDAGSSLNVGVTVGPAVGGGVLFVPGNNTIYAYRGQQ